MPDFPITGLNTENNNANALPAENNTQPNSASNPQNQTTPASDDSSTPSLFIENPPKQVMSCPPPHPTIPQANPQPNNNLTNFIMNSQPNAAQQHSNSFAPTKPPEYISKPYTAEPKIQNPTSNLRLPSSGPFFSPGQLGFPQQFAPLKPLYTLDNFPLPSSFPANQTTYLKLAADSPFRRYITEKYSDFAPFNPEISCIDRSNFIEINSGAYDKLFFDPGLPLGVEVYLENFNGPGYGFSGEPANSPYRKAYEEQVIPKISQDCKENQSHDYSTNRIYIVRWGPAPSRALPLPPLRP